MRAMLLLCTAFAIVNALPLPTTSVNPLDIQLDGPAKKDIDCAPGPDFAYAQRFKTGYPIAEKRCAVLCRRHCSQWLAHALDLGECPRLQFAVCDAFSYPT